MMYEASTLQLASLLDKFACQLVCGNNEKRKSDSFDSLLSSLHSYGESDRYRQHIDNYRNIIGDSLSSYTSVGSNLPLAGRYNSCGALPMSTMTSFSDIGSSIQSPITRSKLPIMPEITNHLPRRSGRVHSVLGSMEHLS